MIIICIVAPDMLKEIRLARIVKYPKQYAYSSARCRVSSTKNTPLSNIYLMDEMDDWQNYLKSDDDDKIKPDFIIIKIGTPLKYQAICIPFGVKA